jgi:hypothetical protein
MSALERFHLAANDTLLALSEKLWPEAKIALVIYSPANPEMDIVLKDPDATPDELVSVLRRRVLSIDGANAYKQDLIDSITGTLVFGAQDRCPPPDGHWAQQFWDMGREAAATRQELISALELVTDCLTEALTGGEVSAKRAGSALTNAAEVLAKQQI